MSTGEGVEADGPEQISTDEFVRSLFAGLDMPDNRVRRHAGYILCETAHTNANYRMAIIEGLSHWAIRRQHHDPVLRTLGTLIQKYDAMVKQALLAAGDQREARILYERLVNIRSWEVDFERDPDEDETLIDVGGKRRIRVPRRLLESDEEEEDDEVDDSLDVPEKRHTETTTPAQRRSWARMSRRQRIEKMPHGREFSRIEELSRFDEFEFLGPEIETRYGYAVRTKTLEGSKEDVAIVRLYRHHNSPGFEQAMGEQLEDWDATGTPGVVRVADWGRQPRPWVAVEFTEETLWERGKLPTEEALKTARDLTGALAQIHQQDLMHGGIDPHSIRFTAAYFKDRPDPMLENVGLTPVYQRFDDPASYTDPRYGAPEYFDSRYGSIDHWTDIYQLGMSIYSAFTGDPPYEGDFEEIRRQALTDRPIGMSPDNPDLPGPLAHILQKATAQQKLCRFETTTQFHYAVRAVCDEFLDEYKQ